MRLVLNLLPGTLSIAATFAVMSVALTGIGLLIRRAFVAASADVDDCLAAFWMGFSAVILFLLIWNFVAPVTVATLTIVVLTGLAGMVSSRHSLAAMWRAGRGQRGTWWTIGGVALAWLWLANLATGAMTNWDTTLYHMQGVQWALTYPVVPGLANLFGPVAFNNASLLYDAMLGTGPWAGQGWRVANGVLLAGLATQGIVGLGRFVDATRPRRAADLFLVLLLPVALDMAMRDEVVSFVTDLSLTAVRMGCMALWYRALTSERRDPEREAYDLVCVIALSAASVALKMNAAVFAVAAVLTAVALWWTIQRPAHRIVIKTLTWGGAIGVAYGVAWMGRGIVLSGYPFFPTPLLGMPVEWRAPLAHARAEFDYVQHSTRHTSGNLDYVSGRAQGFQAWLPDWLPALHDDWYHVVIPLLLVAILGVVLLQQGRRADALRPADTSRAAWWMMLPLGVAIVLWFVMAPAPRYAMAFFWSVAGIMAGQWLAGVAPTRRARANPRILAFGAILGVSPLVLTPVQSWWRGGRADGLVTTVLRHNVRIPPEGKWFQPRKPLPPVRPFTTASGLVVQVPETRCWDTPVPCTPNPAPNLKPRDPQRIERGFVVDGGEWQMQDWPEPWKREYFRAWQQSQRSRTASR